MALQSLYTGAGVILSSPAADSFKSMYFQTMPETQIFYYDFVVVITVSQQPRCDGACSSMFNRVLSLFMAMTRQQQPLSAALMAQVWHGEVLLIGFTLFKC